MNNHLKLAYDYGVQQALAEAGITKTATRYGLTGYSSPLSGEGVPTDPDDLEEYLHAAQMSTPHDADVNTRLNASMMHNTRPDISPYMSMPGQEPVNLSREDLEEALRVYGQQAQEMMGSDSYSPEELAVLKQQMQAFQDKGQHLLSDPGFAAARLEHE